MFITKAISTLKFLKSIFIDFIINALSIDTPGDQVYIPSWTEYNNSQVIEYHEIDCKFGYFPTIKVLLFIK